MNIEEVQLQLEKEGLLKFAHSKGFIEKEDGPKEAVDVYVTQQLLNDLMNYDTTLETITTLQDCHNGKLNGITCAAGKNRSMGDMFRVVKYYYPEFTLKDLIRLMYKDMETEFDNDDLISTNAWFSTLYCNDINKRVYYKKQFNVSYINSADDFDEYDLDINDYVNLANEITE